MMKSSMLPALKSPYPYFGGKSRVAAEVWRRFGDVRNYVEPFFGSGAVLLARPQPFDGPETVNDLNAWLTNFWRAVKLGDRGRGVNRQLVHLSGRGQGVNRQLVHLGDRGQGVNRKLVHLGDRGQAIRAYMLELAARTEKVRIACGNWSRVLGPSVTIKHAGITGIFLDPPYGGGGRDTKLYGDCDSQEVSAEVRKWCRANGRDRKLRIALCGYAGEGHEALEAHGWKVLRWKAAGGHGNQRKDKSNANARKERIWFSPHCL